MLKKINKFIHEKPLIYLLFCIAAFSIVYYWAVYSVSSDQVRLMSEIKKMANSQIRSIVIEPYDLYPQTFKKEILDIKDLKDAGSLLENVNTKPVVRGHVYSIYRCTLTLVSADGINLKFLANVYWDKPSDAYLADNFYIRDKDGSTHQWAMKPVIVPRLGAWLAQKEPQGIVK